MLTIDRDNAIDILALQQLVAHYFWELDTTFGLNSPDFFTEDGVVEIGNMSFSGHVAMRAFYADLLNQQPGDTRTTRHAYTNLRVAFEGADNAIVDLLAIEFSGASAPPLLNASTPTIVSDARLRCRRETGHAWLICHLSGQAVFVGDDPVLHRLLIG